MTWQFFITRSPKSRSSLASSMPPISSVSHLRRCFRTSCIEISLEEGRSRLLRRRRRESSALADLCARPGCSLAQGMSSRTWQQTGRPRSFPAPSWWSRAWRRRPARSARGSSPRRRRRRWRRSRSWSAPQRRALAARRCQARAATWWSQWSWQRRSPAAARLPWDAAWHGDEPDDNTSEDRCG